MAAKLLPINYIVVAGDIIESPEVRRIQNSRFDCIVDILKQAPCPVLYTRGNHDYNLDYRFNDEANLTTYLDMYVSKRDWYDRIMKRTVHRDPNVVYDAANPMASYYYIDDAVFKHRFIVLESFGTKETAGVPNYTVSEGVITWDFALSGVVAAAQVNWLIDEAMDMTGKTDWTVSIHSHTTPIDAIWCHNYGTAQEGLADLFAAFKAGTDPGVLSIGGNNYEPDFTAQGAIALVGHFCGHIHDDGKIVEDDVDYVCCNCACASQRTTWPEDLTPASLPPARADFDYSAMSLNVFVVTPSARTVYMFKLGAGDDFNYSY